MRSVLILFNSVLYIAGIGGTIFGIYVLSFVSKARNGIEAISAISIGVLPLLIGIVGLGFAVLVSTVMVEGDRVYGELKRIRATEAVTQSGTT